ncbi:MAG: rod shape-determining protein MreC [Ferruginibacter sp.]
MRNIFLFINRYFNFLIFLLLQVVSIYFIVNYNKYHQAAFGSVTNVVTGKINTRYNQVEYYFQLKKTNDSLVAANNRLYNNLRYNYELPDTVGRVYVDTLLVDSLKAYQTITYNRAKVVANSVNSQSNYIVIHYQGTDTLAAGMGVVDINNAVVGIITEVDGAYAVVMSLLHKDSHISGMLSRDGETGTLNWDGKETNIIYLTNITKGARVAKGDSVITSGYSTSFPRGLAIGRIQEIYKDASTTNLKLKFRSAANFYTLQYVYVIKNVQQKSVNQILEKIKSQPH